MCANLRLDILEEHIEGGHPLCSRAAKGRVTLQSLGGGKQDKFFGWRRKITRGRSHDIPV